ncbi:MAG: hypothetical protein V4489_09765, partial [Chlamydiota bacterium]
MTTNSIMSIKRDNESLFYEINELKAGLSSKNKYCIQPFLQWRCTTLSKGLEKTVEELAASKGFLYLPYEKSFLTIDQKGEKYRILQINPSKKSMEKLELDSEFNDSKFIDVVCSAHRWGKKLSCLVEYHFFLPVGHKGYEIVFCGLKSRLCAKRNGKSA